MLVRRAYDLPDYLMAGVEPIGDHLYNVNARLPAGATKEQFLAMLQNLLIERFKLEVRREKREMPAYELGAGRSAARAA